MCGPGFYYGPYLAESEKTETNPSFLLFLDAWVENRSQLFEKDFFVCILFDRIINPGTVTKSKKRSFFLLSFYSIFD